MQILKTVTRSLPLQRVVAATLGAALLLATTAAPYQVSAQTPTPTPTAAPVVLVGSGEPGYSVNQFGPKALTVAQGATVTFRANWLEPHTVTFPGTEATPAPDDPRATVRTNATGIPAYDGTAFTNSGFLIQGAPPGAPVFETFQISFTRTGAFPFVCIIHPGMSGTVTVVAAGSPDISTQTALDTAARSVFAPDLTALKAEVARLNARSVTQTRNADGSTSWGVVNVGSMVPPSDVMQFIPTSLSIQVGDTVTWQNNVPAPHIVTFLGGTPAGAPVMSLEDPRLRPVAPPAAGYDGTGFISSGLNGVGFGPNPPFSVKFTRAGTFPYICSLHIAQGMGGTITVSVASAPTTPTTPVPPKTGTGGDAAQTTSLAVVAALALLALAAPVTVRAAAGRRR